MWIDKVFYWKDDGNNTVYPPPTEKRIEYATVKHKHTPEMKIACAVYDDAVKTELYADDIAWHKAHGAEITYP